MESDTFYGDSMAKIIEGFHRENMVNLITSMVSMEITWRLCGK